MAALLPPKQQDSAAAATFPPNHNSPILSSPEFRFSMPPTPNLPRNGESGISSRITPGNDLDLDLDLASPLNLNLNLVPTTITTAETRRQDRTTTSPIHLRRPGLGPMAPSPRSPRHRHHENPTFNAQAHAHNVAASSSSLQQTAGATAGGGVATTAAIATNNTASTAAADHDATQAAMLAVALQMRAQIRYRRRLQKRAFRAGLEDRSSREKRIHRPEVVCRWVMQLPYLAVSPDMVGIEPPRDMDEANFSFGVIPPLGVGSNGGGGGGAGAAGSRGGAAGPGRGSSNDSNCKDKEDAMYEIAAEMIGKQFGVVDGAILEELLNEGESESEESMDDDEEEEEEEKKEQQRQRHHHHHHPPQQEHENEHEYEHDHEHRPGEECNCHEDDEDDEGEEEEEEAEDDGDDSLDNHHHRHHHHHHHHHHHRHHHHHATPHAFNERAIESQLAHHSTCPDTPVGTADLQTP